LWRGLIESFHLLETPYVTATAPSSKLLEQIELRKHERVRAKVAALMKQYHTGDEQEAISRFGREELIKTSEIDTVATKVPPPRFTDHPPMTPDDQLRYRQLEIEGVPVIASFFDQPPTIDVGLSFDLRNVPRKYYKYLPLLPKCLDSLGLKLPGGNIPYSELVTRIQKEVFALSTGYELNPISKRADLTIRASAAGLDEFRRALTLIRQMMESNDLDLSNVDRLRDIVARSIAADHLYTRQDVSTLNAAYSFHHQDDPLFFSLNSRFASAHWDERLKWLLHVPVDSKEVDKLNSFANDFLSAPSIQSKQRVSESLDALKVEGLKRELVEYWKSTLSFFPESEVVNGLRQLAIEVSEDLRVGPARTIEDLKRLQKIVLNRNALHLDFTLNESSLGEVRGDTATFLRSIPALPLESSETDASHLPIIERLEKRYGLCQEHAPWYVGLVNPDRTASDAVFYSNFPSYSQVDRKSLEQVLAAKLFSGGGPRSFYMKSSAAGLAYNSFIRSDPAFGLTWYYAYRSPDIASLIRLVNSTVSGASALDDSSIVDHALSQTFSFSRSAATFSERGKAAAQDIRDGNEPEKIRRFSEAILKLRQEPDLLEELARAAPVSIGGVLLDEKYVEQQRSGRSLFFFVGSEESLSDTERRLSIPKLLRLWPSDYWID
jgi:Zn-dependent M16 (insulinase) family peptidase